MSMTVDNTSLESGLVMTWLSPEGWPGYVSNYIAKCTKTDWIWSYHKMDWTQSNFVDQLQYTNTNSLAIVSGRLEKTSRLSPHHVAQHRPTGSETTPPYAPRSSRFGSEPPSLEDDVDVWCYAIVSCMPETTTTTLDGVTIPLQFFHIISLFAQKEHPQLIMSQQETMGKMASVYSLQSPR